MEPDVPRPPSLASWIRPLRVGGISLESNLAMAPMAGVSNLPFRLLAREAGAALAFTETVSAKGLVRGGAKSWRLLRTSPREAPVAFQLFGAEPEILGEACARLADQGVQWVDLNLGCPVKKFIRNGAGSALLREPARARAIVRTMRARFAGVLSVKMRTGWDDATICAPELARQLAGEGVDLISVHGRTREQQYTGHADRDLIRRVVETVPGIPVLANGDVARPGDFFGMLRDTGAAGVMIGRGAMGNPWIFGQILALGRGRPTRAPSPDERLSLIERHVAMLEAYYEDRERLTHALKKYLVAYSKGLPGSAEFRQRAQRGSSLEEILASTRAYFGRNERAA